MAITIRYSTVTDAPATLETGELAYSETTNNMYIGLDDNSVAIVGGLNDHNELVGKASTANNLSDLADVATARTNLGLNDMSTQTASAINITGGTIDSKTLTNITIDGGTF